MRHAYMPAAQKSSPSIESAGTERVPYRVLRAVVYTTSTTSKTTRLDATCTRRTNMVFERNNGTSVQAKQASKKDLACLLPVYLGTRERASCGFEPQQGP